MCMDTSSRTFWRSTLRSLNARKNTARQFAPAFRWTTTGVIKSGTSVGSCSFSYPAKIMTFPLLNIEHRTSNADHRSSEHASHGASDFGVRCSMFDVPPQSPCCAITLERDLSGLKVETARVGGSCSSSKVPRFSRTSRRTRTRTSRRHPLRPLSITSVPQSGIGAAFGTIPRMKSRNSTTVSESRLDLSRFELFMNVFVRTPARAPGRRALRRR